MGFTLEHKSFSAGYVYDEVTNLYTFTLLCGGGPIITHSDLEEGKREFEEAFHFANALSNLQKFSEISKLNDAKKIRRGANELSFVELKAA